MLSSWNFCGIVRLKDQKMQRTDSQMDILSVQKHVNNENP